MSQLLYGSDLPIADPRPTLRAVQALGDSAADAIFAENATRLLG
jgi:predicted TIM-barrel fold metal-dependent hydrolase